MTGGEGEKMIPGYLKDSWAIDLAFNPWSYAFLLFMLIVAFIQTGIVGFAFGAVAVSFLITYGIHRYHRLATHAAAVGAVEQELFGAES